MSLEEPIIESFDMSSGFVKAAAAFLIGIMLLGGFVASAANSDPKSVTVKLTEIPQAGDTITLGNHVFEFSTSGAVQSGNIPVKIGSTLLETKTNIMNAVRSSTDFSVN